MKKKLTLILFQLFFTFFTFAQEAKDIVKKADDKARGTTSIASISIQTIRPKWSREMTVKAWTKGNDLTMILVQSPAKEKGVVFLKKKKEVWNWIPSIERNIKMPPSMMSQSWMGTDFTNDDLVKEASIIEDYNHSFLEDVTLEGRSCYKIQLIPKPKSAVVWGKIILSIDKKDFMMLHAEYFDEDGKLINTMHCSDIKMLGGRLLPARMEMVPANKKGNKTIMIYKSLVFDTPLEDHFFSTQNMIKVK
ncbi:outer membrane lipoprotein-sorting protein [Flavobacterium luminosum]|uniref:Outer membrane lipoprotein-sorting protein n=1 Tax=Flavobacterium luminosum TaxID=2949086 RepID=A0ABT0TPL2_9FLAO|nr:outer membrane lipoprotein-sorting protein [Flavobacterium sp. HXWNR70]MCL9809009.1 outer membrane lipoprotein-sorting protein [Flavobacterium sp. HXWNR70]